MIDLPIAVYHRSIRSCFLTDGHEYLSRVQNTRVRSFVAARNAPLRYQYYSYYYLHIYLLKLHIGLLPKIRVDLNSSNTVSLVFMINFGSCFEALQGL